jgi:hypothetical protein
MFIVDKLQIGGILGVWVSVFTDKNVLERTHLIFRNDLKDIHHVKQRWELGETLALQCPPSSTTSERPTGDKKRNRSSKQ